MRESLQYIFALFRSYLNRFLLSFEAIHFRSQTRHRNSFSLVADIPSHKGICPYSSTWKYGFSASFILTIIHAGMVSIPAMRVDD